MPLFAWIILTMAGALLALTGAWRLTSLRRTCSGPSRTSLPLYALIGGAVLVGLGSGPIATVLRF